MSYYLAAIKDSPIGLWKLDELFGSIAYDISGCGNNGSGSMAIIFSPRLVNFDSYFKPNIHQIECGSEHSAFVDEIGRLFTCGRG